MSNYFLVYMRKSQYYNGQRFIDSRCDWDNNIKQEFADIKYPIKESMIPNSSKIKDGIYKRTIQRYVNTSYDYFFIREDFLPKKFIIKDYYKREGGAGLILLADIDEINLKDVKFFASISNIVEIIKSSQIDGPNLVITGDFKIIKKGSSLFLVPK